MTPGVIATNYLSGGYFLSRIIGAWKPWVLPGRQPSMAHDHSPRMFVPETWCIEWAGVEREERLAIAASFGLDESGFERLCEDATETFGVTFGAWSSFYALAAARDFAGRHLRACRDLDLWGLGLHQSLVERFLEAHQPPPPQPGYAPVGKDGSVQCVEQGLPPAPGGSVLGFEVLSYAWNGFNSLESLHCDEQAIFARAGVVPNAAGLCATFEDGLRICEALEPGDFHNEARDYQWLPWMLVAYPIPG